MTSLPYTISRTRLAWLASEEWVRGFWWLVITIPLLGIFFLIAAPGALKVVGLICIGWPFSIPARSVLSSGKAGKLFSGGCQVSVDDEQLVFTDTSGREKPLRWRLSLSRVSRVVNRPGFLLIHLRTLGFVPIPTTAFESDEDRAKFVEAIESGIAAALAD